MSAGKEKYEIKVLDNTKSIAGETPVWDSSSSKLYWIDFLGGKISSIDYADGQVKSLDVNSKIGTVVLRQNSGLLAALGTGFNFIDNDLSKMEIISHPEPEKINNRFNDGKCDCKGRLWISTVSQDFENGCATMEPLGSFYCLDTDLSTRTVIDKVIQVNGIAWSPDNKKMYLVDTCAFEILKFDFDEEKGEIRNREVAVKIPQEFSFPDGMCRDLDGNLWVAHWGGYKLSRWNPSSGKLIETIPVPVPNVTCCSFGGPEMDELFITTASFGMTDSELEKYPDAGKIFICKTQVKGPEVFRFKG